MTRKAWPRALSATIFSTRVSIRIGLTPAAGSSRRMIRGSAMRARASSSSLSCPPERVRARSPITGSRPQNTMISLARSRLRTSSRRTVRGASQLFQNRSPLWPEGTSITFSSTVISGNGRGIWKVRATPAVNTSWGARAVDPAPGEPDPSLVGDLDAGHGVEERRLARAVRPDQRIERPRLDGEPHLVDGPQAPEPLGESLHREERLAHAPAPFRPRSRSRTPSGTGDTTSPAPFLEAVLHDPPVGAVPIPLEGVDRAGGPPGAGLHGAGGRPGRRRPATMEKARRVRDSRSA